MELVFCTALQCAPWDPSIKWMLTMKVMLLLVFPTAGINPVKSQSPQVHHRFELDKQHLPSHWLINSVQSGGKNLRWKKTSCNLLLCTHLFLQHISLHLPGQEPHQSHAAAPGYSHRNSTALQRVQNVGLIYNKAKTLPKIHADFWLYAKRKHSS